MRAGARHGGFTLMEVLIATVVVALVALMAHRLFAVDLDAVRQLARSRAELDHEMNGARWLRAALLSLEVGREGDTGFEGHPDVMRFTTYLPTAHSWLERDAVTVEQRGSALVLATRQNTVPIADSVVGAELDYLLEPGAASRWATDWVSPVSAPVAVRVRIERRERGVVRTDTTIYLVKGRG